MTFTLQYTDSKGRECDVVCISLAEVSQEVSKLIAQNASEILIGFPDGTVKAVEGMDSFAWNDSTNQYEYILYAA